jgi:hypothetical protein
MTEAEWWACEDFRPMYWNAVAPRGRGVPLPLITRRVGSLFAVACVRMTPQAAEHALLFPTADVVERAADEGDWREVDRLHDQASTHCEAAVAAAGLNSAPHNWAVATLRLTTPDIKQVSVHVPIYLLGALERLQAVGDIHRVYVNVLRDVFGNPFRPATFSPDWCTDTAVSLAQQMYDSRDFSAMPILADALQDAGCDNDDILSHCRDVNAPHVRGCWVVDLVLGKE